MTNELSVTKSWTPPYVLAMSRQEVFELFQTLPAPTETELDGEYAAYAHLGHSDEDRQFVLSFLYTRYGDRGYWLGKAFTPISGTGEGYRRRLQPLSAWRQSRRTTFTLRHADRRLPI